MPVERNDHTGVSNRNLSHHYQDVGRMNTERIHTIQVTIERMIHHIFVDYCRCRRPHPLVACCPIACYPWLGVRCSHHRTHPIPARSTLWVEDRFNACIYIYIYTSVLIVVHVRWIACHKPTACYAWYLACTSIKQYIPNIGMVSTQELPFPGAFFFVWHHSHSRHHPFPTPIASNFITKGLPVLLFGQT